VNYAQQEQADGKASAPSKAEWTCPELIRLDLAAAEANDVNGSDGTFTS
jgi:hypothetical protein